MTVVGGERKVLDDWKLLPEFGGILNGIFSFPFSIPQTSYGSKKKINQHPCYYLYLFLQNSDFTLNIKWYNFGLL